MRMATTRLLLVTLLSVVHLKGAASDDGCGNPQFQKNRKVFFKYEGVVENGIRGTTNNVTKIKMTSKIEIQTWESCNYLLKLTGTKFYESLGSKDNFKLIPSTNFINRLEENYLQFVMKNGMALYFNPSVKSTQPDVLNIQRGVLSALQVRNVDGVTKKTEEDISGKCMTTYMKREEPNFTYIEKVKDLNSCKDHHVIRSNIDGHSYNDDENADSDQDSVYKSYSECLYKFKSTKKGLEGVVCTESFLARAFATNNDAGAYVNIRTKITKMSSTIIAKESVPYKESYSTTIYYDHKEPENEKTKSTVYRDNVKALLLTLAKQHYYESQSDSAQRFFDLVISLRHLKKSDLNAILTSVDLSDDAVSSFLFDAMTQCGTTTCLTVLFQTMQKNGMQTKAAQFLPNLAFLKEPTPEVIRMLLGFHQKTNEPSLLLILTALSYKMCRNNPSHCNLGMTGQVVKDTENYLLGMLGNDCQTTNPAKQLKILYALKGIGNLGRPASAMPLIVDCIQNAQHVNTSTAAVEATRKMTLTPSAKDAMHVILIEKNNDLEKRVEVFLRLMQAPTKDEISLAVDVANDVEEVGQFRSFINSYLRSAVKSKAPSARKISKLIKEVLEENPLAEYDPSPSRYSKAFLSSFKFMRFGGTVNGHTFFHPDSFVPRSLNFNLTTHLFGFSVNALEVKARMEGVERLIGKYMQDDGYFSPDYLKKIFELPTRQRRSTDGTNVFEDIDAEVGVKTPSPQALVSLKIFGNEVGLLNLNDLPFLNGELDDVNVIQHLYMLTKGKRKVFKQNMVVMEVTHTVPTILGIPLKIAINGSAVVTTDINGKVKIDMKKLLMGPKSALLTGSVQPSVSIHASGKLSVACPGVTEVGTSFLGNVHFGKKFEGSIAYEEGKEMKAELKADDKKTDLLNVSYNIFHETKMKKEKVNGIEKRAKGYFCTDEIFDTSLTGTKICTQASFPNGYYDSNAPFFPMTGPFEVGVRSYPVDPLLTKYRLHVKKEGDTFITSIGTPGATLERKYTLTVGVGGTGGKVGLMYGEENRGFLVHYSFDKFTNEIQGSIESNLTALPLKIYGEFFNITDPATLNRHVGVKGRFKYRKLFIEHTIFYKNTYEYWALGSKFEYSKGKAVTLDMKIQYQPQMIYLTLNHEPTNTNFIAKAFPSLPTIEGAINITHGKNVDMKAFGQIDISKYEVAGNVNIKPGNHKVSANGKWIPEKKHVFLTANLNEMPLNWKADLKSKSISKVNVHEVTNNIKVGDKEVDITLMWNIFSANYTVFVDKKRLFFGTNFFSRTPDSIRWNSVIDGENMKEFQMLYEVTRTAGSSKQCTRGSYDKRNFGSCYTLYHAKEKFGLVYTMKEEEKWKTPWSFLVKTTGDKKEIEAKIYKHMTVTYSRSNKDLSLYFAAPKFQFDISTTGKFSGKKLKYTVNGDLSFVNGTFRNQLNIQYNRSTEAGESNTLTLERVLNGESLNKYIITSDVKGKSFNHVLKLNGKLNAPIYTVIVKDKDTKKPDNLGEENYLIYDMDGWRFKGFENNIKNEMLIRTKEIFNEDNVEYLFQGRQFDEWVDEQAPVSSIASLKFLSDGKAQFHLFETPMTVKYKTVLKAVLGQLIKRGVNTVFLDTLKLDKEMVKKLSGIFQQAAVSYFSSIKCNGEKVHEQFIKGQISKEDIVAIILRILKFPMSKEFKNITGFDMERSFGERFTEKLQKSGDKTVIEFLADLLNDVKELSGKDQVFKEISEKATKLKNLLEKDQSFNVFEKEFFGFMQQTANEIQKVISNKGSKQIPDLKFITKHLPAAIRSKVKKTLTDVFKVLINWKYDVTKDPMINFKELMNKLEAVNATNLLNLDHGPIILGSIIEKGKLPILIKQALKSYLNNLDHVFLVQKLSKFTLQTYRVPAPHNGHITKLLQANNVNEYFKRLATIIKNNGQLSAKKKEPFKEYLKAGKMSTLIKEFQTTLRAEYKVDDVSINLLKTMFSGGDAKSFEYLPAVYTVNFLPKLLTKLLENVQDLNVPSILKKLTGFVKDKKVKKTLDAFVNNQKNLNQIPAQLIKLAIKKSEKAELDDQDKKILKEVESFSLKIIAMIAGDKNKNLSQQVKQMALIYYDSVKRMLKSTLPKSLASRSNQMFSDIRKVLQNIKVQDLEKDATGAIEKATKNTGEVITKFLNKNLEKIVTEDLMDAVENIMKKYNTEQGSLWDKKEKLIKAANDRLSFLIRLLGQFSGSKKNIFAERFTKDGKILYYKIYQSVWNSKVSSQDNLKQIDALFQGLEKAAMEHLLEITGDGSIAVTSSKILKMATSFIDGETWLTVFVNFTQTNTPAINIITEFLASEFKGKHTVPTTLNKILYFVQRFAKSTDWVAILQEYNKDKPTLVKVSYEVLLEQIKELLIAIGHASHERSTINHKVKEFIPQFLKSINGAYKSSLMDLGKQTKQVEQVKGMVRKAFETAKEKLKATTEKENNIIVFLLDILLPGIDNSISQTSKSVSEPGYDACTAYYRAEYRKPFGKDVDAFESDKDLQKMIKDLSESSTCRLWNLFGDIQKIKKDKHFVNSVLDKLMDIVLNALDENLRNAKKNIEKMKVALETTEKLSQKEMSNPLQETIYLVGKAITEAYEKDPRYGHLERSLGQKLDAASLYKLLEETLSKMNVTWTVPTTKAEKEAKQEIARVVKMVSKTLNNISKEILFGIDNFKTPLSNIEFVADPVGYVKRLPNKLVKDVLRNMAKHKKLNLNNLRKLEKELKRTYKNMQNQLQGYSGKLNQASKKMMTKYKSAIKGYLKPALDALRTHNQKMNKELNDYMLTAAGKGNLKEKLRLLSTKANEMRNKYKKMQEAFVQELKKNVSRIFSTNEKLMKDFNNDDFLEKLFANIDRDGLAIVLNTMNQDLKAVLTDTIYPHLTTLVNSVDETVCKVKKNISKFYTVGQTSSVISWQAPGVYRAFTKSKEYTDYYGNLIQSIKDELMKNLTEAGVTMENVQKMLMEDMEQPIENYAKQYQKVFTDHIKTIYATHRWYQKNAAKEPDAVVEDALKAYQSHIKRVAIKANQAIQIVPPESIEKPLIKFLGLEKRQSQPLLQPLSRTAYLFEHSIVTFDGKPIYLPKGLKTTHKGCVYLLTRDFLWKNFTVYLNDNKLVVELKDGKIVVDRDNQNKVEVFARVPPSFTTMLKFTDLPVQMAYTSVVKIQPNVLKIQSRFGLTVHCRLDSFSCNFTVSGYYHNKAMGLFGTNNVESSDDLRLPNGEIALDLVDFLNSYEITKDDKCMVDDVSDIVPEVLNTDDEEEMDEQGDSDIDDNQSNECNVVKENKEVLELVDFQLRSDAFYDVCRNEKSAEVVREAYMSSINKEFGPSTYLISPIGTCSTRKTLRYSKTSEGKIVQLTVLLKLLPALEKVRPHLKTILRKVQQDLGENYKVTYTVVGYGGERIRSPPHLQTGDGDVFMNLKNALKAVDMMEFRGKPTEKRQGLSALKFASDIAFKQGSKIFLLFDNDESYTNSLREMIEVNNALNERGIVLNVVNNYKMRRDVIGKDTSGKRYHVREPLGEDFPNVSFPPPDDYIPLVKQSRGAIFTLKAFTKSSAKWSKALPIAVKSALKLQAKIDQAQCKQCQCGVCKNVLSDLCDVTDL